MSSQDSFSFYQDSEIIGNDPRFEQQTWLGAGFHWLSVEVTGVDETRNGWWIELEGPLVLKASRKKGSGFTREQVNNWIGKRFLVRGWVVARACSRAWAAVLISFALNGVSCFEYGLLQQGLRPGEIAPTGSSRHQPRTAPSHAIRSRS